MEVPGLPESEEEDDVDYPIPVKKNTKVTFSTGPIKVSETCVYCVIYSKVVPPLACNRFVKSSSEVWVEQINIVGFEVLNSSGYEGFIFLDIMPHSPVEVN
jgi:hypothetical protein